jgi:hypothetical protein
MNPVNASQFKFLKIHFVIIYSYIFQVVFYQNLLRIFPPDALLVQPISFFLIWSPEYYLLKGMDNKALCCTVFSISLFLYFVKREINIKILMMWLRLFSPWMTRSVAISLSFVASQRWRFGHYWFWNSATHSRRGDMWLKRLKFYNRHRCYIEISPYVSFYSSQPWKFYIQGTKLYEVYLYVLFVLLLYKFVDKEI